MSRIGVPGRSSEMAFEPGATQVDHDETGSSAAIDEAVEESLQAMLEDVACKDLPSGLDSTENGQVTAAEALDPDRKRGAFELHHPETIDGNSSVGLVSLQDPEQTQCNRDGQTGTEVEQDLRSAEAGLEAELSPSGEASRATGLMVSTAPVEEGLSSKLGVDEPSEEHIEVREELDNPEDSHLKEVLHTDGDQQVAIVDTAVPAGIQNASLFEEQGDASRRSEVMDLVPPCIEENQQKVVEDGGIDAGAEQEVVSEQLTSLKEHSANGDVAQLDEKECLVQPNGPPASADPSTSDRDEPHLELPAEEADTGPIPFFIINAAGRKAASPRLSNDTIDFGVPGARITADRFVGMRYVREGSDPSQNGSASPGSRLLEAIQEFPAKTVAAAEKTVTSLLAVLPSPRKGLGRTVADPAEVPEASNGDGVHGLSEANGSDTEGPPSTTGGNDRRTSSDSTAMHVWEILWKDHSKHSQDRPGGTLQQVQFETSKAGFRFIQRIIDVWSLEATDSSAMTEAAKALLKSQDRFQETPTDSPFSKPDPNPSTFPRSLFGRARPAANGASTSPTQTGALQRLSSDALSGVERTESGVSVADSVDSLSSVKSVASASSLSIALVASGNRNGYEGGLQHVVIPESEDVSGGVLPVEKPGAPLVEGRFLPNMIPHSHVLQQPHIRALAAALPVRYRLSAWALLYSTWRDGISLQTLYRKAAKKGPGIMVILDTNHNVFGCYTSENWKVHPRYYGSGECFVFQLYPEMRIYRWTHDNSYFMFGTPDSVHIGGGSHFALSVRGDLLSGCTGACETFGNGPLVTPEEYGILHVELWGFQ